MEIRNIRQLSLNRLSMRAGVCSLGGVEEAELIPVFLAL